MLPQLAVSAKILCLLMVVICGAVPSMVRSVRLFNRCSHHYVDVVNGTVMARSSLNDHPDLTIISTGPEMKLLFHSPRENAYLCFNNKWKLVARHMSRDQAQRTDRCLFWEGMENGYNIYSSVANASRFLGFNSRGLQLRRPRHSMPLNRQLCVKFMKEDNSFDITRHNRRLGGEVPRRRRPARRPDRQPAANQIAPRCQHLRHSQSRHIRRKSCDET